MSYKASISITTDNPTIFQNIQNVSISNAFRNIGNHFQAVGNGAISEAITVNSGNIYGSVTFTMTAVPTANDTLTVNGTVFTAVASTPTTANFLIGSGAIATAVNLANTINANVATNGLFRAAASAGASEHGIVTITALSPAVASYTLSKSMSVGSLSSTTLLSTAGAVSASNVFTVDASNLSAADTLKIGITTFTAETSGAVGNQFNVGSSPRVTADNIAAAINAYSGTKNLFSAVSSGTSTGIVTVTVLMPGTIGNQIPVTKSATHGVWTNTTFFVSGLDANIVTLHHGL